MKLPTVHPDQPHEYRPPRTTALLLIATAAAVAGSGTRHSRSGHHRRCRRMMVDIRQKKHCLPVRWSVELVDQ